MKVLSKVGREDIAVVYIARSENGKLVEFVESVQPPLPLEQKWGNIISTSYGCPVGCRLCDAGGDYQGKLSTRELMSQIDYLVTRRFPDRKIPVKKYKIQFARMGEPSYNPNDLEVLEGLPERYDAPGLVPCVSTVAPSGIDRFFDRLLELKRERYNETFQLQFSIHTTDRDMRDWLIPVPKWDLERIAEYGAEFCNGARKKVTLNFSLSDKMPVDPDALRDTFPPDTFLVKLTPVNPTFQANRHGLASSHEGELWDGTVNALRSLGYDVIPSIGELEESHIGSNCGQYVTAYRKQKGLLEGAYTYDVQEVEPIGPQ